MKQVDVDDMLIRIQEKAECLYQLKVKLIIHASRLVFQGSFTNSELIFEANSIVNLLSKIELYLDLKLMESNPTYEDNGSMFELTGFGD